MSSYCYFDITIGGVPCSQRVVFELFDDITPITCTNFRQLCLGNDGKTVGTTVPMSYKNTTFHRVIGGFMIQGGDFTNHNGTGGVSIYGEKFADENFEKKCNRGGLLAMANAGPGTNGSQFFITAAACEHLNGKHVVFGRVVRGMNTVRQVEHTPKGANDKPVKACVIADCGVVAELEPVPTPADGDTAADYPEDADTPLSDPQLIEVGEQIRQAGNNLFKAADYAAAAAKYEKAVRYINSIVHKTTAIEPVANEKLVACHSNTAMCYIKLSNWAACREAATAAIAVDRNNVKAMFRRATAMAAMGDYEMAIADLNTCARLDPPNADVTTKLAEVKELEKRQQAKQAAGYKKFFSS